MFSPGDLLKVKGKASLFVSSQDDAHRHVEVTYKDVPFLCLGNRSTKTYERGVDGVTKSIEFQYVLVLVKGIRGFIRGDLLELA